MNIKMVLQDNYDLHEQLNILKEKIKAKYNDELIL
jgi:hypothetical protein